MKYQPKRKADENQIKALKKMRGKEAFALLMAMRMRKTKVIVDEFGEMELAGKVKDLIVIAPGGVYRTWAEALHDDLSEDLANRITIHVWQSGSGAKLESNRQNFLDTQGPRALLMNVEALSRPGDAREFLQKLMKQRAKVVVIDESVCIKNKSKRTEFIIKHVRPQAQWRRILSGLPTPRAPLDLFFQFEFLDWEILGFRSWYAFRAHVAFMKQQWFGGRSVMLIDQQQGDNGYRPEAIKELNKLIEPHSFRVAFRPKVPTTYSIRDIEMTKEQKKAYNDLKEFATTELEENVHVTATVVIAQIMRMHQILCGHTIDELGNEHAIPENKTAGLMDLLDDYAGKAIIWCSYDADIRKISEAIKAEYGEKSVARFWGGNIKTREAEKDLFRTNKNCRFIVATPDAGRFGQTWDMADLVVYYSSKDNLDHREQSEQRAMGRDKTRGVDIIDLIHRGTVEEKILTALRKKINMAATINGDNWREWVI